MKIKARFLNKKNLTDLKASLFLKVDFFKLSYNISWKALYSKSLIVIYSDLFIKNWCFKTPGSFSPWCFFDWKTENSWKDTNRDPILYGSRYIKSTPTQIIRHKAGSCPDFVVNRRTQPCQDPSFLTRDPDGSRDKSWLLGYL